MDQNNRTVKFLTSGQTMAAIQLIAASYNAGPAVVNTKPPFSVSKLKPKCTLPTAQVAPYKFYSKLLVLFSFIKSKYRHYLAKRRAVKLFVTPADKLQPLQYMTVTDYLRSRIQPNPWSVPPGASPTVLKPYGLNCRKSDPKGYKNQ